MTQLACQCIISLSPRHISRLNFPSTPRNRTSPLAPPIQPQIADFPHALTRTTSIQLTIDPPPILHHVDLPRSAPINPLNRLSQTPHARALTFRTSPHKYLCFNPPRVQSPHIVDGRSLVRKYRNSYSYDDFLARAFGDGAVVGFDRFAGVAACT
jgi:hypothetical protein